MQGTPAFCISGHRASDLDGVNPRVAPEAYTSLESRSMNDTPAPPARDRPIARWCHFQAKRPGVAANRPSSDYGPAGGNGGDAGSPGDWSDDSGLRRRDDQVRHLLGQKNDIDYDHREMDLEEARRFLQRAQRFAGWAEEELMR